jgi:hypothetical protein
MIDLTKTYASQFSNLPASNAYAHLMIFWKACSTPVYAGACPLAGAQAAAAVLDAACKQKSAHIHGEMLRHCLVRACECQAVRMGSIAPSSQVSIPAFTPRQQQHSLGRSQSAISTAGSYVATE